MASMAPVRDGSAGPPTGAHLEAVYREHYRSLVRLASLLVDDVGTCEELVQDAFVAVWRREPVLRDEDRLPAYLRSAVLNGARSHLRRSVVVAPAPHGARQIRAAIPGTDPSPGTTGACWPPCGRSPIVSEMSWSSGTTSTCPRPRSLLTLGISAGSVKTHAHRGLASLETRLEDLR